MANHLADPPERGILGVLKRKTALGLTLITFLVLFLIHPAQPPASSPVAQPSIIISSMPSASNVVPPPVVQLQVAAPNVTPVPTMTVPVQPTNVIPSKDAPIWIDIPAARISVDVSLLPMTESQRQERYWVPPNVPNAFWVDSFDQPGANSTDLTLIMAHACDGLAICQTIDWQFGRLSDANLMVAGTEIIVTTRAGKVCYVADSGPVTYEKDQLKKHAVDVWGKDRRPGKLVLISCYTGDIHEKNVVVIASLVSCNR